MNAVERLGPAMGRAAVLLGFTGLGHHQLRRVEGRARTASQRTRGRAPRHGHPGQHRRARCRGAHGRSRCARRRLARARPDRVAEEMVEAVVAPVRVSTGRHGRLVREPRPARRMGARRRTSSTERSDVLDRHGVSVGGRCRVPRPSTSSLRRSSASVGSSPAGRRPRASTSAANVDVSQQGAASAHAAAERSAPDGCARHGRGDGPRRGQPPGPRCSRRPARCAGPAIPTTVASLGSSSPPRAAAWPRGSGPSASATSKRRCPAGPRPTEGSSPRSSVGWSTTWSPRRCPRPTAAGQAPRQA